MTIELNLLILLILSILSIVIAIVCGFVTLFALRYSMEAKIAVGALEKSTHAVQYVPLDPKIDLENQEWSTKQEALDKERKMYQEDIETEFPMFAETDEDKKVYTF